VKYYDGIRRGDLLITMYNVNIKLKT